MAKKTDLLKIKRGEMIINKVNELILSKTGRTDLFTLKILDYMIYLIQNEPESNWEYEGRLHVRLYATDFIRAFGYSDEGGFVYNALAKASFDLMDLFVYAPNISKSNRSHNKSWSLINVVEKSDYREGVLEITFTSSSSEYLCHPGKYFTRLDLYDVGQFETLSSTRLFELLKSKAYEKKWESEEHIQGVYKLNMGINELRFTLNTTDITKDVAEKLNGTGNFNRAMELSLPEDIRYEEWKKLKCRILDPAIEEINSKTDLYVSYEIERSGKGGKATGIVFTINTNGEIACTENIIDEEYIPESIVVREDEAFQKNLLKNMELFYGSGISDIDVINIFKAADNDYDKVKAAYSLSKKQKNIKNLVAWMITAIKNDYASQPQICYSSPEKKKKNMFNDFPQRGEMMTDEQKSRYNYLFEKKLISNGDGLTLEEETEFRELGKIHNLTRSSRWGV